MPTTLCENRPSPGIGVVEVQKLEFCFFLSFVFFDFVLARAWSRCKNSRLFCDFVLARATLCGDRRGRGARTRGFLRFCLGPRDPLRGSAWSRCKNSRFFTISAALARPSAGIGVVEVQKLAWSRCKNSRFLGMKLVLASYLVVRAPAPATGGSRVRSPPGPRAGFASCTEQLA